MNSYAVTESRKFAGDVGWVAISQVFISLIGIVTLPALTKSYPAEVYGVWVQASVTVGLLSPLLTLHLGLALVRFLAGEEDRGKRNEVFYAMLWPVVAFAGTTVIVSFLMKQRLSVFLFATPQYLSFVPLTFLWASLEALYLFTISYLRARRQIKKLAMIQVAVSVSKIALIVIPATFRYSLIWIITSLVTVEAFFVLMILIIIIREIGLPKLTFAGLTNYMSFSVPQALSGIMMWIIGASDRYFITHFLNLSQAGIYSASYTLGSLASLYCFPIGIVLLPAISRFWEQNQPSRVKSYLEYSTKLFLALAIPSAIGLSILSQPLLDILAVSDYKVGSGLVLLVAIGTVLLGIYQINVYIILLIQQTKWLPLMIGSAAATNAAINVALIPRMGIAAAAISTIAAYFILALIVTVWARKTVRYEIDLRFLVKVIAATAAMAFYLMFLEINSSSVLSIVLTVIAGTGVFVLVLLLLRAFSAQDLRLLKDILRLGGRS